MSFDLGQYIAQLFQGLRGPAQSVGIPGIAGDVRPNSLYSEDDRAALRTSATLGGTRG